MDHPLDAIDPGSYQHQDIHSIEHDFIENHAHPIEEIIEENTVAQAVVEQAENLGNPFANVTGVNVQELFEKFWDQASSTETYIKLLEQFDESLEGKVEIPFGVKPHHLLLAGTCILLWTIFIFFLGYFYARIFKSKLGGEIMAIQLKLFQLEAQVIKAVDKNRSWNQSKLRWKKRLLYLLILVFIIIGAACYFIDITVYYPKLPNHIQYAALIIWPILWFILRKFILTFYDIGIKRSDSRIFQLKTVHAIHKDKYRDLMEKDNHPKVQDSINKVEHVLSNYYQSTSKVTKPTGQAPIKPPPSAFPQPQQPIPVPVPIPINPAQHPATVTPKQPVKPIGNYTPKPITQPIANTPKPVQTPSRPVVQTPQNKQGGKNTMLDGLASFVVGKEDEAPYAKASTEKKEAPEGKQEHPEEGEN